MKMGILRKTSLVLTVIVWLGSFVLVIPATLPPPNIISFAGFILLVGAFSSPPLNRWGEYFLFSSYWIGLFILLVTSGLVIFASGERKRTTYRVLAVDVIGVIVSLLIGISLGALNRP